MRDRRPESSTPQPGSEEPAAAPDTPYQPEAEDRESEPAPEEPAAAPEPAAEEREEAYAISDPAHIPLAVYRFDPLNGRLRVTRTIDVEPNVSRGEALNTLLGRVNGILSGRRIQWSGIDQTEQGEILVLDLVDGEGASGAESWYNSFQGSSGGAATQGLLAATFLQPAYRGDWYDGVRFLLNGDPMREMDHINLSGVFLRDKPIAEHMIVSMSEPGEMTGEEIAEYLQNMLELPDDVELNLARVQSEDGTPRVVFFTSSSILMVNRGVLRLIEGVPRVLSFEPDPCNCFAVAAEPRDLVRSRGEFVVTRFSPLTGTCVGFDVVRILALEEDGTLLEVWRGTTFEGDGSRSRVATGELIDCGDDCLCREGPVLETFETLFAWSPEEGRFAAIP